MASVLGHCFCCHRARAPMLLTSTMVFIDKHLLKKPQTDLNPLQLVLQSSDGLPFPLYSSMSVYPASRSSPLFLSFLLYRLMMNSTNVGLLAFLILFSIIFYVCIKSSRLKIGDFIIRLIMTTQCFSAASVADINKRSVRAKKKALVWPHIS